jgi:hypothetical protein
MGEFTNFRGAFGIVFKGVWRRQEVAVKQILNPSQMTQQQLEDFLAEASLMRFIFGILINSCSVLRPHSMSFNLDFVTTLFTMNRERCSAVRSLLCAW